MANYDLTQARLKELLHYDPDTGIFVWNVIPRGVAKGRKSAGGIDHEYIRIRINRVPYYAHRLAVLYMTGAFPVRGVDHINRNTADNSWLNLREADQSQNLANTKAPRHNTSGIKGVSWCRRAQKWDVRFTHNGAPIRVGTFKDKTIAAAAYAVAYQKAKGEFARLA